MSIEVGRAVIKDLSDLLGLYALVYGRDYPLAIGNDPVVMADAIRNHETIWIVARDNENGRIVGSLVAQTDPRNKIGRLLALVVHPEYRRLSLASKMTDAIIAQTIGREGTLNSIYTTTRTLSIGPQAVFLNQGFKPLGVFPNAHRVKDYETLTLMAKFRDGVLEARAPEMKVPEKILPIARVLNHVLGQDTHSPEIRKGALRVEGAISHEFEFIFAPDFVKRRFLASFPDPFDRFYPFHEPNLLIAAKGGGPEVYAYFGKNDGYCTIVGGTEPFWALDSSIDSMISGLSDFGASYIETLVAVKHVDSLNVLLEHDFLPSAVYPAMLEIEGGYQDFVLLSRTGEPLNFKGMAIDTRFKPYIDQFVKLWSHAHFDAMEVVVGRA